MAQNCHCTSLQCFCKPRVMAILQCAVGVSTWSSVQRCWLCKANPDGRNCFHNCSQYAPWRKTRYMAGEFIQDLKNQGLPPKPLFSCPGFSVDRVVIGVLHCLDLGVTQEVFGYVLWEELVFQFEECQMRYNVDKVATALQGAGHTRTKGRWKSAPASNQPSVFWVISHSRI